MQIAQHIEDLDRAFKCLQPDINALSLYSWNGRSKDQFVEFVKRSALVRQFECILAVRKAFDAGTSHLLGALLRPAYEELLWMEYLQKIPDVQLKLLTLLAQDEIYSGIQAQSGYFERHELREIGFTSSVLDNASSASRSTSEQLKAIGKKLGWRQGATKPTIANIAKQVNRYEEYVFLYHATSRAVHFSAHELGRRVWGSYGDVKISSTTFSTYWNDFNLIWQWRIFCESALASDYNFEQSSNAWGKEDIFKSLLTLLPRIQIVTMSEMERWPESRLELK